MLPKTVPGCWCMVLLLLVLRFDGMFGRLEHGGTRKRSVSKPIVAPQQTVRVREGQTKSADNCVCVFHYQCDKNYNVITAGEGVIDRRMGSKEPPEQSCPNEAQICCRVPPGAKVPPKTATNSTAPAATTAPSSVPPAHTTAPPKGIPTVPPKGIPTVPPASAAPTKTTPGTLTTLTTTTTTKIPPTIGTAPPIVFPDDDPTTLAPTAVPTATAAPTTAAPIVVDPTVTPAPTTKPAPTVATTAPTTKPATPSVDPVTTATPTTPTTAPATVPPIKFPTEQSVSDSPGPVSPTTQPANPGAPGSKCGVQLVTPGRQEDPYATSFAEYPWMVVLLDTSNNFVCGASLIKQNIVLTAAHCVEKHLPNQLVARIGEWDTLLTNESLPHQNRSVSHIKRHEDFNNRTLVYDIALLRLEKPVEFAKNVVPVCLPDQGANFTGKNCVATGWGRNAFGHEGKYQTKMRQVTLPVIAHDKCQTQLRATRLGVFFVLNDTFMCAGGAETLDTCTGDGGGPLVCKTATGAYVQAGITSWGIGCGQKDVPGVYVDIGFFSSWINSNIIELNRGKVPK